MSETTLVKEVTQRVKARRAAVARRLARVRRGPSFKQQLKKKITDMETEIGVLRNMLTREGS